MALAKKKDPKTHGPQREISTRPLPRLTARTGLARSCVLATRKTADIGTISTGAMSLDVALGIPGVPRGRIVEIYGAESSGKTTVCLSVVANAQRNGGIAAFVDTEHALDPSYARLLGVNTQDLLVSQPDCGEDALNIAETLVRSNAIDVLVIDSVAALVPRAEIEGQMGDSHVGLQARLMSQALRKLTGAISRGNTCVIFTNQTREKIGVMYGNPTTTTGGNALKFYASVRMEIRRAEIIKDSSQTPIGNRCGGEGGQEQAGTSVPAGFIRHHVRGRNLKGRFDSRRCYRPQDYRQERCLVLLRRDSQLGRGPRAIEGGDQGRSRIGEEVGHSESMRSSSQRWKPSLKLSLRTSWQLPRTDRCCAPRMPWLFWRWLFGISVVGLVGLGVVMLYSTSSATDGEAYLKKQVQWLAVGGVFGFMAYLVGYRWFCRWRWWLLFAGIVPVAYLGIAHTFPTLSLPCAPSINGAHRWLSIGGQSVQPSEFGQTRSGVVFGRILRC